MATILVIDDDPLMLDMLQTALTQFGHIVTALSRSTHVEEEINATHYDLVITDIVMPERDGVEIIKVIRKMRENLKILALSGGGQVPAQDYLEVAKILGADQTLQKPFPLERLKSVVEELLEEQS